MVSEMKNMGLSSNEAINKTIASLPPWPKPPESKHIRDKRSASLTDVVNYLVYKEASLLPKGSDYEISEKAILKSLYALREDLKSLDIHVYFENPGNDLIHSRAGMEAIWSNVPFGYDSNWRYGVGSLFYLSSRKGEIGLRVAREHLDDKSIKALEEMSVKFHAMNQLRRN